jgi:hypothetical protein
VLDLWLPLAASWLLMAAELPLVVAAVSRLPETKTQLAALGGIVYPISLVIEAPIVMVLTASTALARDRASHAWLSRVVYTAGAALTLLHLLIAATPLYDVVARDVLGAEPTSIAPARLGLLLMTPWTLAIAYRRYQQGLLIRFERSRAIGAGTALRLLANGAVLALGLAYGGWAGATVGGAAIASGVIAEALFAAWMVRPVRRERLPERDPLAPPLALGSFLRFYVPLAITPFLAMALQPLGAAAINRMPEALTSIAAWPAVYGFVFLLRSFGFAFQEVTVRLLDEAGGRAVLRAFALRLSLLTSAALLLLWATPLAGLWFRVVSGLPAELADASCRALVLAVPLPGCAVWINYYQGVLVQARRTRPVTAAVVVYVAVCGLGLALGVAVQAWRGLDAVLAAFTVAGMSQTEYLRRCAARLP